MKRRGTDEPMPGGPEALDQAGTTSAICARCKQRGGAALAGQGEPVAVEKPTTLPGGTTTTVAGEHPDAARRRSAPAEDQQAP
jgi:hypothetical protein